MSRLFFLVLVLLVHLLLLGRLTFTAWPEMLSYPYLMLNGFSLYKDFIMPYPPGLVLLLAGVFSLFGFTPEVLKIFTWGLILTTDLLMYKILGKVIGNKIIVLVFLSIFIFLQSFLEGNMLWFDFATVAPLLIAFWFGIRWLENQKTPNLFLVGFFLTLAILIKQIAAIYFLAFVFFYLLTKKRIDIGELKALVVGSATLLIPFVVYLVINNSIMFFWNWAVSYPLIMWPKFPGYVNFAITLKYVVVATLLLLPLFGILLNFKKFKEDKEFILAAIFLISTFIAVYPRFSFFHLQPVVAFAVILFAKIFIGIKKSLRIIYMEGVLLGSAMVVTLLYGRVTSDSIRFYNKDDQVLTQEIIKATDPDKTAYLLGLNSSQYVFANRLPPKNWSDNFGWYLEISGVQEWTIQGFEQKPPEKIFWRQPSVGKWYELGSYQPQKITEYIRQHYEQTGKIGEGMQIWTRKN